MLIADYFMVLMMFVPSDIVAQEPAGFCYFTDPKNDRLTFEKFDIRSELCCIQSGKHPKKDKEDHTLGCCGNGTYKTEIEVCCANRIFDSPITSGQNAGRRQICCKGKLHLEESQHYCCGNQYIKTDHDCCNGSPYNNSTHYCADDTYITPHGFENCGDVHYNRSQQKCCGNSKLYNVPGSQGLHCCGLKLINSSTHQCCPWSNKKIPQPRAGHCCGKGVYNHSTEICCGGHKFLSYGVRDCCGFHYFNKSNPREDCCFNGNRTRPFNKDKEICCDGEVHTIQNITSPGCCGKQVYSSKDKICCNDNTLKPIAKSAPGYHTCGGPNPTKGPSLCGKLPYTPEKDLCCNNKIHKDAKEHGKKCCGPTTQAYFTGNETCCSHQVQPISLKCTGDLRTVTSTLTTDQAPQPSGVCEICSSEWKPTKVYQLVNSTAIDICTKKAIIIKFDEIITHKTTFPWTQLTITYKANLYRSSHNHPLLWGKNFKLLLPCSCLNLHKMKKKKYLLLTNINFQKREIFLGDGDLILPLKRNLKRLIKQNSKKCPQHIVNNIKSIL